MNNSIRLFCPATVANVCCGFDVLGFCLSTVGDEMIIHRTKEKGIRITKITGADLTFDPEKNVAGVAALALLNEVDIDFGFDIEIHKKINPGSGIGSSAASASGVVFGINELLNRPFTRKELVKFAMKGEAVASGCEHADNVAPALLGGFTLVRGYKPLDVIRIESPSELFVTLIHPHIELKTSEMRSVLKPNISLESAIIQWGNLGGLIAGLYTNDYDLIKRSLHDEIIESLRSPFIPNFDLLKKIALEQGALGCGISGSGPSVFVLSRGFEIANNVNFAINELFSKTNIPFEIYISKVDSKGIQIMK